MHVYDKVWSTNEYVDIPEWVMVDLSEVDKRHIVEAQEWLSGHNDFRSTSVNFTGRVAYAPCDTEWGFPMLRILRNSWYLDSYHPESGAMITVHSNEASDNWRWDNVERVAVEI